MRGCLFTYNRGIVQCGLKKQETHPSLIAVIIWSLRNNFSMGVESATPKWGVTAQSPPDSYICASMPSIPSHIGATIDRSISSLYFLSHRLYISLLIKLNCFLSWPIVKSDQNPESPSVQDSINILTHSSDILPKPGLIINYANTQLYINSYRILHSKDGIIKLVEYDFNLNPVSINWIGTHLSKITADTYNDRLSKCFNNNLDI